MAKTNKKTSFPSPQAKIPSAENILKWLEEANQFVKRFLPPKDRLKWNKIKHQIFSR